jgi:hypothetical protein
MKEVREWDESDLVQIVKSGQKETTTLDYKASASLAFKDKKPLSDGKGTLGDKHRQDIIRDVASMAIAEGGLIIYGIKEKKGGYPDRIDDGMDPQTISAEQIEQIILTNINPRVEGLIVHPIDLKSKGKGNCAFVISVLKAEKNAPHQADDKVYYRRHDATKLKMEDNEIRDMIGRSLEFGRKFGAAWDLLVEVRRIVEAAEARSQIGEGVQMPRDRLKIEISPSLRSSGVALMALARPLRRKAADLIGDLDQYNSFIDTADPGQRETARLTVNLRFLLKEIVTQARELGNGLLEVLKDETP